MDNLRLVAHHLVFKLIIVVMVISFILTGFSNSILLLIGGGSDYAAQINGQEISRAKLELAVQEQEALLATSEADRRQQVLFQLIDEMLLEQYAKSIGLVISNDQIKNTILAIPYFHTDQQFDNVKYRSIVNKMGLTTDQYAALINQKLLIQQLFQGVSGTAFLLPGETDSLLAAIASQSREARLATFNINALAAKQTVTSDEITVYYKNHQRCYIAPEQFKVSYILLNVASIQAQTTIDEREIKAWYDQHQAQFRVPEQKRYRIIQSNTEDEAKKLLKQLQHGGNFAALAKNKSTDVIISEENTLDEFKQAKLSHPGQLSGIIKSAVGFWIVRLEEIRPSHIKALNTVHDVVATKVKHEKVLQAYSALQKQVRDAANNNPLSLASAEATAGVKVQHTRWFSRDKIPAELNFAAVKSVLLDGSLIGNNGEPGRNSDLINVDGNRAFVISIVGYKPESVQPLAKVHRQVTQDVKRHKAISQSYIEAEKALTAMKLGNSESDALSAAGISFSAPKSFYSAHNNKNMDLVQTVFNLPQPKQNKTSYGIATDDQKNIVLVALDKVTPLKLDHQQRQQLINQLNQYMNQLTFSVILENLRSSAKITLGRDVF